MGEELQVPAINGVKKILSIAPDTIVVERELENEIETLSIPLPAVIAVTSDINVPVIPSMKAILGAAKNQFKHGRLLILVLVMWRRYRLNRLLHQNKKVRQRIIIEGDGDDQVAQFAEHLRKIIK